jgi:hypothetical protein
MSESTAEIPPELLARLAHPTVRLSGSIDDAAAASFLDQVLPALDVPGSIVVELFSSGGDAEVGRRLAQEVRLLVRPWPRSEIMAGFPEIGVGSPHTTLLIHGRRMMRNAPRGPLGRRRPVCRHRQWLAA